MTKFKMAYAKTHLASLIKEAIAGQEVVIARDETPLVRLVPIVSRKATADRAEGDLEGRVSLPDSLFAPLAKRDAEEWGL
jgi:antitoxin (DNA-binding transcriptional repressor) of toxin-antitoxin stability system